MPDADRTHASSEGWTRAYREAPEVFDAFARAEDPEGRVVGRLRELLPLAGRRVLELGCGTGRWTRVLAGDAACWVTLEPARAMLAFAARDARAGALLLRARAERLPVVDGAFDVVFAGWVLANARPAVRAAALAECERALAPGGEVWLLESHWGDELAALRGRPDDPARAEVRPLLDAGFELVETVRDELRFESSAEAERVLGYLCGERARAELVARPRARVGHDVVILRRAARAPRCPA